MSGARRSRSLFWTIAALLLLTAVAGTLLQGFVVDAVLRPLETRELRARAELAASSIANEIAAAPTPPRGAQLDSLLARHHIGWPAIIVFRAADGTRVVSPPGAARFLDSERRPSASDSSRPPPGPSRRLEVIAERTVRRGATSLGEVEVLSRARPRPQFPGARTWLLFLPIALVASVAGGLVMVRLLVGRLRTMELLAARVAQGDLEVRIADRSGDEIGRLAEQLDRMTERLAEARARLEGTERQRRQLFADITHELATPLTSIRGYAETLLDPAVSVSPDERTHYVRGVLDEAQRLDRLIRDLFELARLEAGASPLVKERLDWAALCRNTVERFEPRFRQVGLRLAWRPSAEAWIEADGRRIEQVLENLLTNALRYVPAGGEVEVSLEPVPGSDRFRLTVQDDGPGIGAEELPFVFQRFYRGDGTHGTATAGDPSVSKTPAAREPSVSGTAATRDPGGSGLGLAIVREIVERHGGTVSARTRQPHGLEIAIELPARR